MAHILHKNPAFMSSQGDEADWLQGIDMREATGCCGAVTAGLMIF